MDNETSEETAKRHVAEAMELYREPIRRAVLAALADVGLGAFKETSMFGANVAKVMG